MLPVKNTTDEDVINLFVNFDFSKIGNFKRLTDILHAIYYNAVDILFDCINEDFGDHPNADILLKNEYTVAEQQFEYLLPAILPILGELFNGEFCTVVDFKVISKATTVLICDKSISQ